MENQFVHAVQLLALRRVRSNNSSSPWLLSGRDWHINLHAAIFTRLRRLRVVRIGDQLAASPIRCSIRCSGARRQRPGVPSHAFMGWAQARGIRHTLIEPDGPIRTTALRAAASSGANASMDLDRNLGADRSAATDFRQDYAEVRPPVVATACHQPQLAKAASPGGTGNTGRGWSHALGHHRDSPILQSEVPRYEGPGGRGRAPHSTVWSSFQFRIRSVAPPTRSAGGFSIFPLVVPTTTLGSPSTEMMRKSVTAESKLT